MRCKCKNAISLFVFLGVLASGSLSSSQTRSAKPTNSTRKSAKSQTSDAQNEERLRVRLQINPKDRAAHEQLQRLFWKNFSPRALLSDDATWIKNNPNDCSVEVTELVSIAKTNHDPEFAIEQLRAHLSHVLRENDPQEYDGEVDSLAVLLVTRGRPAEALSFFDTLVTENPTESGLWADRSEALVALGRFDDAITTLRHSIELNPASEITHEWLADAYLKAGDLAGAESEYRAAVSVYNTEYKGNAATNDLNSFVKQMVAIEAKYQNETALAKMHLKLAQVLLKEKKYDAAVAETEVAIKADKDNLTALYLQSMVYEEAGKKQQTQAATARADQLLHQLAKDTNAKDMNKMGDPRIMFLIDTEEEGDGVSLPRLAVRFLEPRTKTLNAYEHAELAEAYFQLYRFPEAKVEWEQAMAQDAQLDNATFNGNIGESLLKAGDLRGALPHLQRAYELEPENSTYRADYERAGSRPK